MLAPDDLIKDFLRLAASNVEICFVQQCFWQYIWGGDFIFKI